MKRSSGILMPLSCLPSPGGIGTMGKSAYEFIDFLAAAGQSWWQFLPLGPTSCGNSPYSSFSTFAGNLYYIDPALLVKDGLLTEEEVSALPEGEYPARADYDLLAESRDDLLRLAYSRRTEKHRAEAEAFLQENRRWLENYALYIALKQYFGQLSWTEWPDEEIRLHREKAVENYSALLREEIAYQIFVQYLFFSQWKALRDYAAEKGIRFIGDVPIYVALDSADVWSEPQFFLLDENHRPVEVAGVPPDAFTDEGQLWGNPLYDWDAMRADGYGWWIRRMDGARRLYDAVRIDHFRAFESFWAVPADEKTAINGCWKPGPGLGLVGVLTSWFWDMSFIAEDLGVITEEVRALVRDSGLPGMKVLQFAFDAKSDSLYLPHHCTENSVCYVGTHDNDTVLGWLEDQTEEDREFAAKYMNITEEEGWNWGFIRTGMATPSRLFMVQMQDVLGLDGSCRMNRPGVALGNWEWRMRPETLTEALSEKLREYTERYRRI